MRRDQIRPGDVAAAGDALLVESVQRTIEPRLMAIIQEFGAAELANLGVDIDLNMADARVVGFLSTQSALRSVGINATTKRQLLDELSKALIDGDSSIPARVRRLFTQAAIVRSRLIARTTVNTSANFAVWLAHTQSGSVAQRRWVAVRDGVTRDHHLQLHGQRRSVDRPFQIPSTGRKAMYPGGFGIPSEDINCRCTTVPSRRIRADADEDDMVSAFDRRVATWETVVAGAIATMFLLQMRDVLSVLSDAERRG